MRFSMWSFLRAVLEQGVAIGQDYQAGKYPSYEQYATRMDEAAREREEEFNRHRTRPAPFLETLRQVNVDRCINGFKHELDDWSVMEWGCAIGGEAGELLNVLKKIRREEQNIGGSRIEGDRIKTVADEIADIVIYCDLLAAKMGIDLQTAVASKFDETSRKVGYGGPELTAAREAT